MTDVPQLSKKQRARLAQAAKQMSPLQALMSRVGVRGKPTHVAIDRRASAPADADAAQSAADSAVVDASGKSAAIRTSIADGGVQKVTLPPGLRLARIAHTQDRKDEMLYYFLLHHPQRTLVFVNAVAMLKSLHALLSALQLPVTVLHAHMQQKQRFKSLERFKANQNGILIVR